MSERINKNENWFIRYKQTIKDIDDLNEKIKQKEKELKK